MQHDHVLKKLDFDLLTHRVGVRGEGLGSAGKIFATVCCCICDSLKFDMQHDQILKKLNFDPIPSQGGLRAKHLLPCCCIYDCH